MYDIAGLTRGASTGAGLGNAFLSHIRAVDAIFEVVRCFDDAEIIHVEGDVDPIRDLEIIQSELRIKDAEFVEKQLEALKKQTARGGLSLEMRKLKEEQAIVQSVYDCLTVEKVDVRKKKWGNKEVSLHPFEPRNANCKYITFFSFSALQTFYMMIKSACTRFKPSSSNASPSNAEVVLR